MTFMDNRVITMFPQGEQARRGPVASSLDERKSFAPLLNLLLDQKAVIKEPFPKADRFQHLL